MRKVRGKSTSEGLRAARIGELIDKSLAQLQLFAYNADLCQNFSSAVSTPHGIVGISVLLKLSPDGQSAVLDEFISSVKSVSLENAKKGFHGLSLLDLLPSNIGEYVTYEGSFAFPGCEETVTWIVFNEALSISQNFLNVLRTLRLVNYDESPPMSDNSRPLQPTNRRSIKTNIRLHSEMEQMRAESFQLDQDLDN
ncbi:Carbonic anhydrase- protein 10, partial [Cichlidogyrus casuarinus]